MIFSKHHALFAGMSVLAFWISGCSTQAPAISHVHIGHTMTSWVNTPNKEAILATAEREARATSEAVAGLAASQGNLSAMKAVASDLSERLLPSRPATENGVEIISGLIPAIEESLSHLEFAAVSSDASANVKASVPPILEGGRTLVASMQQMKVLADALAESASNEESAALAGEIASIEASSLGEGNSGNYDLKRLRSDVEAMIAREDPPYTTADSWYLLNLIRLPNGDWIFRSRRSEGGSGGGY